MLDQERCTLCLACVGSCPKHALGDSPARPELKFDEGTCVQCGLCAATCPEQALTLAPQLDFTLQRGVPRTLKAEEPCLCRVCGKPFGAKGSITRVQARLVGNPHFAMAGRLDLVGMCGDCRVRHYLEQEKRPLSGPPRPRVHASDDYITAPSPERE